MDFNGNMVALVIPFRNGAVDGRALAGLVEAMIAGGVSALVPCGTTGESPTLTHDEHNAVVATVCELAQGRVPVMAGTGSNSTQEAIDMTRAAEAAGAQATLQVVPYYNKPSQEGLYRHFKAIADGTGLPVCLYNIPGRCAAELTADTIARLAEHPRIVAIKEATGRLEMVSAIRERCDLAVLAGDDALTLPIIAAGGVGVVSVLSNLLPERVTKLVRKAQQGEFVAALELHAELFPLMQAMFLETNPVPVKTALAMCGRIAEEFRLPLCPMTPANRERLAAELSRQGLM